MAGLARLQSNSAAHPSAAVASATEQRRRLRVSRRVFLDLVRLADLAVVAVTSLVAFRVYGVGIIDMAFAWPQVLLGTVVGVVVAAIVLGQADIYRIRTLQKLSFQVRRVLVAWSLTIGCLIVLAGLAKISDNYSRGWLLLWWFSAGVGLLGVRAITYQVLHEWIQTGRLRTPVAIVGAGETGQRAAERLASLGHDDVHVVGVYDDRPLAITQDPQDSYRSGTLAELIDTARRERISRVMIALPLSENERIAKAVDALQQLPVEIDLYIDLGDERLAPKSLAEFGGVRSLRLVDRPLRDWHGIGKAFEDFCVAAVAVGLCAPLMFCIAMAIKLDTPGPILFRQKRFGFNNKEIVVYKFRTMHVDEADPSGRAQTVRNDPRITRIGRFLRRSNLDELPQFINVLQGRLSVVGPRPHPLTMRAADKMYHEAVDNYANRHRVKPGITGWAQVNGLRGETDTMAKATARIAHDLYYIENWSVWFDLRIILLTVVRSFRDPNAY